MSRSDLIGSGCTLIVGAIAYFIGGPIAAILALIVGIALIVVAHMQKMEEEPEPQISDAIRVATARTSNLPKEGEPTVLTLHDIQFRTINPLASAKWDNFTDKLKTLKPEEQYVLHQFVLEGCHMLEGHAQELVKAKYHFVTNPLQAIHTKTGFITPGFNGYDANPGIVAVLEQWAETYIPPAPSAVTLPTGTSDGVTKTIAKYVMQGQDQLLAYTTTREGLPGTRFLVVRNRPNQQPQSCETPNRDEANARWNEWYQEWKNKGFGGASGTGLFGEPPF